MKYKKSAGPAVWLVGSIVLILLFLYLYSNVWVRLFGKETSSLKEQLGSAGDSDNDGVINIADKCPCPPDGRGVQENEGCPSGHRITNTNTGKEDRTCLTKKA